MPIYELVCGNLVSELLLQILPKEYFSACILISMTSKYLNNLFNMKYQEIIKFLECVINYNDVYNSLLFYKFHMRVKFFRNMKHSVIETHYKILHEINEKIVSYAKLGSLKYTSDEKYQEIVNSPNIFKSLRGLDQNVILYNKYLAYIYEYYDRINEYNKPYYHKQICDLMLIKMIFFEYHEKYCTENHCMNNKEYYYFNCKKEINYYEICYIRFENIT